jgi:tetratricopeptide (TPR) repeat protein
MDRAELAGGPGRQGPVGGDPAALPEALVAAQRWDAAAAALGPALAADPQDPRLLGLLVRVLRAQGRRAEAVSAARSLLTVAPQDPYAHRLATLVLLDQGWVDEAIGLAARAVALDPVNAANHLAVSRAWAQSGAPGAADHQLAAAREAVLLEPNSPDAQLQIGLALARQGDMAAARAAYREALRLDPGSSAALNNLAVLDLRSGDHGRAARWLADALAADPQGRAARHNLDAIAVRSLHRAAWWLLAAPLPALVAAAAGAAGLARLAALAALLGVPLLLLRAWQQLRPGQRRHLRGLGRRIRLRSWGFPAVSLVVGGLGLLAAGLVPADVTAGTVIGYLVVVGALAILRTLAAMARPGWREEIRARTGRWRRS